MRLASVLLALAWTPAAFAALQVGDEFFFDVSERIPRDHDRFPTFYEVTAENLANGDAELAFSIVQNGGTEPADWPYRWARREDQTLIWLRPVAGQGFDSLAVVVYEPPGEDPIAIYHTETFTNWFADLGVSEPPEWPCIWERDLPHLMAPPVDDFVDVGVCFDAGFHGLPDGQRPVPEPASYLVWLAIAAVAIGVKRRWANCTR